jgi:hypothetical protein
VPWEWVISRVCEEFHCLPSQAVRELEQDPDRLALNILSLRDYARAKRVYDSTTDSSKLPESPVMSEVMVNDFALHRERLARREE